MADEKTMMEVCPTCGGRAWIVMDAQKGAATCAQCGFLYVPPRPLSEQSKDQ
jgi:ribosomal protein L37E